METMGFVIDLSVNVDVDTPVRNFGFVDVRSLHYLWMCTLLLCFLLPYRFYMEDEKINRFNILLIFVMIPLGLISGAQTKMEEARLFS